MPKRAGSGRKTLAVEGLFTDLVSTSKIPKVSCTFCSKNLSKNGTSMTKHLQDCKKCPDSVKEKYIKTTTQVSHPGFIGTKERKYLHFFFVQSTTNIPILVCSLCRFHKGDLVTKVIRNSL